MAGKKKQQTEPKAEAVETVAVIVETPKPQPDKQNKVFRLFNIKKKDNGKDSLN